LQSWSPQIWPPELELAFDEAELDEDDVELDVEDDAVDDEVEADVDAAVDDEVEPEVELEVEPVTVALIVAEEEPVPPTPPAPPVLSPAFAQPNAVTHVASPKQAKARFKRIPPHVR
jgi:hypothetical protein